MTKTSPVAAWIVDDTGLPKKGTHSVGVARQYCGQTGKQDNCQGGRQPVGGHMDSQFAHRLPFISAEIWANDSQLRQQAKIPNDIAFQTKLEIALARSARPFADGIPQGTVLADPAYGNDTGFRQAVAKLELSYVLGIQSTTTSGRREHNHCLHLNTQAADACQPCAPRRGTCTVSASNWR